MPYDLIFILILGLAMGFVTSISGGAGVFAVPAMLAFGIPPINTLALNRISDIGVLAGALKNYTKAEGFEWKTALIAAIPLFIGSVFGALFSVRIDTENLKLFIIFAVFIGIFLLLYPIKPKGEKAKPNYLLGIPALLCVGFWDGAVAMAGATFAVIVLVLFFHRTYLAARSIDVAAAIPETIISTLILTLHSTLTPLLPLAMMISSLIGAYIGSHIAIKKGSGFIRKAMVAISLVMVGKIIFVDMLHLL